MQSQLDQFLRKVHRRWLAWRTLERVGLCTVVACGFAAVLAALLIYRGEPALSLILAVMLAGVVCGLLLALIHCPTPLDTAIEIDRQLNLHDLLATALSLEQGRVAEHDPFDSSWRQTVLAQAAQRVQSLQPRDLVLHRLGARAWGGIGLSSALVVTMGLISANPVISEARHPRRQAQPVLEPLAQTTPLSPNERTALPAAPQRSSVVVHDDARPEDRATAIAAQADRHRLSNEQGVSGEGAGAGAAHTPVDPLIAESFAGSAESSEAGTGIPAGGAGRSDSLLPHSEDAATGQAGSASTNLPQQDVVSSASTTTEGPGVQLSDIPDDYRDLVRDYFTHD